MGCVVLFSFINLFISSCGKNEVEVQGEIVWVSGF